MEKLITTIYDNFDDKKLMEQTITDNISMFPDGVPSVKHDESKYKENEHYLHIRGICYYKGLFDFPIVNLKAKEYFEKVLEINNRNSEVLCQLAYMYKYGHGGGVNMEMSIKLFTEAIDLGNARAMNGLAVIFERLPAVEGCNNENYAKAFDLYNKAVELGNVDAMYNLVQMWLSRKTTQYVDVMELIAKASFYGNNSQKKDTERLRQNMFWAIPEESKNLFRIIFANHFEQKKHISALTEKIIYLEQEILELRQVCYMPGGIGFKKHRRCQKHFYDLAEKTEK